MPTTVMWFEILSYLGLFLQVIAGALIYPELSGQLGEGFVYALTAIYISMSIFLIWSAARRRKNWARWFLLVGFGLGLLFSIPTMADDFKSNIVLGAFNAIMLLLDGAALYLLFSPQAQPWFAKVAKPEKKSAEDGGIFGRPFSYRRIIFGMMTFVVISTIPILCSAMYGAPVSTGLFRYFVLFGAIGAWAVMGAGERPANRNAPSGSKSLLDQRGDRSKP